MNVSTDASQDPYSENILLKWDKKEDMISLSKPMYLCSPEHGGY